MTELFEVMAGDVVIFLDERLPHDGEGDVNCVGVVVDERGAFYIDGTGFFRRVRRVPLNELSFLRNLSLRRPEVDDRMRSLIERYFSKAIHSYPLFDAGMLHMHAQNWTLFERGTLFPSRPSYNSTVEHAVAWDEFIAKLQPWDAIFTRQLDSRLSGFIAWATHGPWSHVASYEGDGIVQEVVTSGYRRGSVDVYKSPRFWVAAYRHVEHQKLVELPLPTYDDFRRRYKDGYSYIGALRHGVRAFGHNHTSALVPNSFIYCGRFALVDHV